MWEQHVTIFVHLCTVQCHSFKEKTAELTKEHLKCANHPLPSCPFHVLWHFSCLLMSFVDLNGTPWHTKQPASMMIWRGHRNSTPPCNRDSCPSAWHRSIQIIPNQLPQLPSPTHDVSRCHVSPSLVTMEVHWIDVHPQLLAHLL